LSAYFDNPNNVYAIGDLVQFNKMHVDLGLPPGIPGPFSKEPQRHSFRLTQIAEYPKQEILEKVLAGSNMSQEPV